MRSRHAGRPVFRFPAVVLLLVGVGCGGGGTDPNSPPPPPPPPPPLAKLVAVQLNAGGGHTCIIRDTGAALCWGRDDYGQLGLSGGAITTGGDPRNVRGGLTFDSVKAGFVHTCALTASGAGYCWGWNREDNLRRGALGDGTDFDRSSPVAVVGGLTFRSIVPGGHHSCGITTSGAIYCWGKNSTGELGTGDLTGAAQLQPVPMAGGIPLVYLTLGYRTSCGLTAAGKAYCWGDNGQGQLGNGTLNITARVPVAVAGDITFRSLHASIFHDRTCGLAVDSTAYCWGSVLTANGLISQTTPLAVSGGMKFAALSGGADHTCGLTTAGAAHCWGSNRFGALGDGTTSDRVAPVAVTGGLVFTTISAGADHTCGLTAAGVVYCWGGNFFQQLGDGGTTDRPTPAKVSGF